MALPSAQTTREWAVFTVVVGSRVYRAMLLTLVSIALAPLLLGWQPFVVQSGSMEPTIAVGDVALGRPFQADEKIEVGRVYMLRDPSVSEDRILVHRVVELRDDHKYTTAGDANAVTDATPVTPDDMRARAILLVPYVGLPVVWMKTGQWGLLALWLLLSVAAFFLATRNIDGEPPKWTMRRLILDGLRRAPAAPDHDHDHDGEGTGRQRDRVLVRGRRSVASLVAVCLVGSTAFGSANAAFTATTRNPGNVFTAGAWQLPYVAAVTADAPRGFWLLDETSGTAVRDYSRTHADGTTRDGTVQRGLPGAHTARNPGTSFRFDGGGALLHSNAVGVGDQHTVELWFRTTSTQEGYLIGFEQQGGSLTNYDRTVLMNAQGRIVIGDWSLLGRSLVTTPRAYNDGQWHHLVVATSPGSWLRGPTATVYVDGAQVAQGETTGYLTSFTGNWQIGQGRRAGGSIFTPFPVTVTFRGDIDAVAVYPTALTPAQVQAHWNAR